MSYFIHPKHSWSGLRRDRTQLWPILTLGWWTVELLPDSVGARLIEVMDELRRKDRTS